MFTGNVQQQNENIFAMILSSLKKKTLIREAQKH